MLLPLLFQRGVALFVPRSAPVPPRWQTAPPTFSIEYGRREAQAEPAPEIDAQDALSRAMSRALGHENIEETDEPKEYRL
nr:hypothetical protein [Schwartzia sp. (in: firmicutes)]